MAERVQSIEEVLSAANAALTVGSSAGATVIPTGFGVLDRYLSGGLRSGELALLGGPQGLGKTTFVLQVLRHVAKSTHGGIYFSYEHDAPTLLERFLAAEAGDVAGLDAVPLRRIRSALEASDGMSGDLAARLAGIPGGPEAVTSLGQFSDRLLVYRASGATTTLDSIRTAAQEARQRLGGPPLVVVDYLQKVAVPHGPDVEEERVTLVVEGLKDLALELDLPVLAIVAAEKEGLTSGKRLRVHHLRGSSALAYEPDVVLVLNDKFDVVARHHLVFDVGNAERFRDWVVLTIEKNRSGLDRVDLEFRKRFEQARFEIEGQSVEEQLVDERVFVE